MRLDSIHVHGLRRFGGDHPHKLRLDNKLVCLIGANEVGKSTLLDALVFAREERQDETSGEIVPVDPLLLTRGEEVPADRELVRARYRLEEADEAVLAEQPSASRLAEVHWYELLLKPDGTITPSVTPDPTRDKTARWALAKALTAATDAATWPAPEDVAGTPADATTVAAAVETLEGSLRYLSSVRSALDALADWLDETPTAAEAWLAASAVHRGLSSQIRETLAAEAVDHPTDQALGALAARVPRFVSFDKHGRSVNDEYDLADPERPEPLVNLVDLAGLDLDLLYRKIQAGETGTVDDLLEAANKQLAIRFRAWTQTPPVEVSLGYSGTRLFVHVRSGVGPRMRLGERSEGLRQFVALVALTAQQQHKVQPILLIDEIEMHLHYDAQADLVGVLAEQQTASQVIYTTHSAACLPEDLGSAVRVIEGIGEVTASRIRQQFWADDVGLGTLLMAMGAGSLALVMLRPAALVEGGADLVLLPSLMREATSQDPLGFQIVPGGAEAARERITGLDLHGTATIWIYDGDQGGIDAKKFLVDQGVDANRILLLRSTREPLELEDLVDPDTYVAAVNTYGRDVGASDEFGKSDLPAATCARHGAVEAWFAARDLRAPSKVAVANKVLDFRGERRLVDPKRKRTVAKLHAKAIGIFEADEQRREAETNA